MNKIFTNLPSVKTLDGPCNAQGAFTAVDKKRKKQ
jgi:hypothetical protein